MTDAEWEARQADRVYEHQFGAVCSGDAIPTAPAYDSAGRNERALYFETFQDRGFTEMRDRLPSQWQVPQAEDPNAQSDLLRSVSLIVCVRRASARLVKTCDYRSHDGTRVYSDWHDATYEVQLKEIRTANTIAQTTIRASAGRNPCLNSITTDADHTVMDHYATPRETELRDFLTPYLSH